MARQPVIPALLVLAAACRQEEPYGGAFDLPIATAVLQPEDGGPFEEPIGFVANGHGGQIVPLALKQGRFLNDDPTVSFLRTNPLATGGERLITSIAVTTPSPDEVTLWAGDRDQGTLLRVPYLLDCALDPEARECAEAVAGAPVEHGAYHRLLEEPASATLEGLDVKKGYTTTETWTVTWDGAAWQVEGSRSGREPEPARAGERYSTRLHRLGFTLRETGSPRPGDRFVVKTMSGLSEHDVGGAPLAITAAPEGLLALIVQDTVADRPVVRWFDPTDEAVLAEVALPADARPHRLAFAEDGALLVADAELPAIWEVGVGQTAPIEHPLPWPALDVASLDGEDRRRLFVVPLDGRELWLFDRDTGAPIDVNPALEGDQGMTFTASVAGIEALRLPYRMPEYTDDPIRLTGRAVGISLSTGRVVFAHERTGCLVQDALGPRTLAQGSFGGALDYTATYTTNVVGPALLESTGASGRHVVVNACAGIAKAEIWTVRFDQAAQVWRVRGSRSGDQVAAAREDERYLSDDGAVSFTIRSGTTPSRDGWSFTFQVEAGVAEAAGQDDGDTVREYGEARLGTAGDPTYFFYRAGLAGPIDDHEGEGWYPVDIRPFLLVPGGANNEVGRVDPERSQIDVGWF